VVDGFVALTFRVSQKKGTPSERASYWSFSLENQWFGVAQFSEKPISSTSKFVQTWKTEEGFAIHEANENPLSETRVFTNPMIWQWFGSFSGINPTPFLDKLIHRAIVAYIHMMYLITISPCT